MRNSTQSARALKEQMEDDTVQKCIYQVPQKRQRKINRTREGICSTGYLFYQHTITNFSCLLMSFETALHCDMGARQPKCQDSVMGAVSLLTLVMPLIVKKVVLSLPDTMSPET